MDFSISKRSEKKVSEVETISFLFSSSSLAHFVGALTIDRTL